MGRLGCCCCFFGVAAFELFSPVCIGAEATAGPTAEGVTIPAGCVMVTWGMSDGGDNGPSTGSSNPPSVGGMEGDAEEDMSDREAAETELPSASIDIDASSGNAPDVEADDVGGEVPLCARTRMIFSGI